MSQDIPNPATDTQGPVVPDQDMVKALMARIGPQCNYHLEGLGPFRASASCTPFKTQQFSADSQTEAIYLALCDLAQRMGK